jgi:hypothetical protein
MRCVILGLTTNHVIDICNSTACFCSCRCLTTASCKRFVISVFRPFLIFREAFCASDSRVGGVRQWITGRVGFRAAQVDKLASRRGSDSDSLSAGDGAREAGVRSCASGENSAMKVGCGRTGSPLTAANSSLVSGIMYNDGSSKSISSQGWSVLLNPVFEGQ